MREDEHRRVPGPACCRFGVAILAAVLPTTALGAALIVASASDPPPADFPLYPAAEHFAWQSVVGADGSEIAWDAHATPDAPGAVIAYYRERLSPDSYEGHRDRYGEQAVFRIPSDKPSRVLSVLPVRASGPHDGFRDRIPPGTRTVIIVSRMRRRPSD